MSTALRYASLSGYLAVRKNTLGDVTITTSPNITLQDEKPVTLATGMLEVEHVVKNSNVAKLLRDGIISIVV